MEINIFNYTGDFAENKDVAHDLRVERIMPCLKKHEKVFLDFAGVRGATQSFVHALLSDAIRQYEYTFNFVYFKNCSPLVKEIVQTVAAYMQEGYE